MTGTVVTVVAVMLAVSCLAGWLRAVLGPKGPRAQIRTVDASGGFATADQVRTRLSVDAVRQAGAQVRPSLPVQQTTRKGLTRGSR
ncbi:hypothetical protein [Streptomyces chrestomyceticus]|uniref:hypothetical protein n=1 Tax=Streptomyces chrestomyceticus TaxID=68185 RepID=UPI0033C556F5